MSTTKHPAPGFAVLNLGFGNVVPKNRVVAIVSPLSAPMKRLKDQARELNKLIDATQGRKTRSIVVTDSDHVILSAIQSETMASRYASDTLDLDEDETLALEPDPRTQDDT